MSSFVFVSHANADKGAIRHIVDALITANRKVWLDNPAAMGYASDEIDAYFHRIHAGRPWREEINEALLQHKGLLGRILASTLAYERCDWESLDTLGLEPAQINDAYMTALAEAYRISCELLKS